MKRYRTIVADPPWQMPSGGQYKGQSRWKSNPDRPSDLPYSTMPMVRFWTDQVFHIACIAVAALVVA